MCPSDSLFLLAERRTGLYPDRKCGPWTSLSLEDHPSLSFFIRKGRILYSVRSSSSSSSSPPLISFFLSLASFSVSLFLGKLSAERGIPSFSFVRLIPRESKRKQDGRDRWHPVPLFRGKLEEEVAFKISSIGFLKIRFSLQFYLRMIFINNNISVENYKALNVFLTRCHSTDSYGNQTSSILCDTCLRRRYIYRRELF